MASVTSSTTASLERQPAEQVVTSLGDSVTGIETVKDVIAGRAVLLDVGRAFGDYGELPDGFAITEQHLEQTIAVQGTGSSVGRGDIVLVAPANSHAPGETAGAITPVGRHQACHSQRSTGFTGPRSPQSLLTPGDSRYVPTSLTTRSSRFTRLPSRTSGSFLARCGTSTVSPRLARRRSIRLLATAARPSHRRRRRPRQSDRGPLSPRDVTEASALDVRTRGRVPSGDAARQA